MLAFLNDGGRDAIDIEASRPYTSLSLYNLNLRHTQSPNAKAKNAPTPYGIKTPTK